MLLFALDIWLIAALAIPMPKTSWLDAVRTWVTFGMGAAISAYFGEAPKVLYINELWLFDTCPKDNTIDMNSKLSWKIYSVDVQITKSRTLSKGNQLSVLPAPTWVNCIQRDMQIQSFSVVLYQLRLYIWDWTLGCIALNFYLCFWVLLWETACWFPATQLD